MNKRSLNYLLSGAIKITILFILFHFHQIIGNQQPSMMRTSFVAGNDTMFTSPNAALRFVPQHDKHVSFEIPMLATGGHLSGIQNTNQLKTYIKNLLRNGQTGESIRDLLSTIDGGELAPIWDRKSSVYFVNLQSLNEYITSGLDSTKYFETIQKIKPVQESYINLNAFAEVLLDEYLSLIHI